MVKALIAGGGVAVRHDPPGEVVSPVDDDALEQTAPARDGRVVDDREHAHAATVAPCPGAGNGSEQRQLGRRRLHAARGRDGRLVE